MKTTITTLLLLSISSLIQYSFGENCVKIKNFSVGSTEVSFSFTQPQNEYLVATTRDMVNWDLSKIFESHQSEIVYTTARVITPPAREFFVVCELSTTNKLHSGDFEFSMIVTSAENGQLFVQNEGSATMQATSSSTVGDNETVSLSAVVDLNNLTIDIFDSTATLVPSGLGYTFDFVTDYPLKLEEEASNEEVQYYTQNSEIVSGRYDLCKGTISMVYTEVSTLTWNLTADVSVATTSESLISSSD